MFGLIIYAVYFQVPNSSQKPVDRRLDRKGRSNIKHSTNFACPILHSGYAGGSTHGSGKGGTNSKSESSSPKGGAAVIPMYAGSAGANNHHHQSALHGSIALHEAETVT
ncbi:hypothetical protein ACJRO7_003232 [Eucalyptus globulus]|uniref:Uncharacterized protein n=1 Tax=Eucalyptus globulus TaxID=34317 RepID=A0ABD3IVL3_EUCGL